jgi:DNA-binding LytR/AlgR family response regulator
MKVVIIEDEKLNADHLESVLESLDYGINVIAKLNSVAKAYSWFINNNPPDLIFLDIELGDGTAFDLLDISKIDIPIIFTTAYNEYAVQAFRYNSIDYILKPIGKAEVKRALEKHEKNKVNAPSVELIRSVLSNDFPKQFKQRFLVKSGNNLVTIDISEIAYFFSEDSYTHIMDFKGKKWLIDYSLEDLEEILNPVHFFRLNRKVFSSIKSINTISSYFNGRLSVQLLPVFNDQIVISREKVKTFKDWLDR